MPFLRLPVTVTVTRGAESLNLTSHAHGHAGSSSTQHGVLRVVHALDQHVLQRVLDVGEVSG